MFPKHTKSIFVMILVLRSCICTISITHFVSGVESHFCVCSRFYPAQQLCFGPTIPFHSLDVPCLILQRQIRFQNNHILRPADLHGLLQNLRSDFIGTVKLPHSPQVPGGETRRFGIMVRQIACRRNSGAFFFSGANQPPNFTV